jgi:hypothetical protein
MKIIRWLKHNFGFHDITKMEATGDYRLSYVSPWDMFPTRYDEYKCPCGECNWFPPMDFFELYWDKKTRDLTLEVANAWYKEGNIDNAIAVLRGKDLVSNYLETDNGKGKIE